MLNIFNDKYDKATHGNMIIEQLQYSKLVYKSEEVAWPTLKASQEEAVIF